MDSANQLGIFLLCVGIGVVGSVMHLPFRIVSRAVGGIVKRRKGVELAVDLVYFTMLALGCVWIAYVLRFPNFRVYQWLGYAVGGIIYLKFLHKTIAFFENICYNKISQIGKKAKKRRKTHQKTEKKGL